MTTRWAPEVRSPGVVEEAVPRRAGCRRRGPSVPTGAVRRRRRRLGDRRSRHDPQDLSGRVHRGRAGARRIHESELQVLSGRRGGSAVPASRRPCGHRPDGGGRHHDDAPSTSRPNRSSRTRPTTPAKASRGDVQWSSLSTTKESCSSRRTRRGLCTRSVRSTTGSRSPRSASTTSSRICASPESGTPTCAATATTAPT